MTTRQLIPVLTLSLDEQAHDSECMRVYTADEDLAEMAERGAYAEGLQCTRSTTGDMFRLSIVDPDLEPTRPMAPLSIAELVGGGS